jgi:hypothetical protein
VFSSVSGVNTFLHSDISLRLASHGWGLTVRVANCKIFFLLLLRLLLLAKAVAVK